MASGETIISTRFWSKVDTSGDCWEWLGRRGADGYGRFDAPEGDTWCSWLAHRYAWRDAHLELPDGLVLVLDHLCRNRGCVNPKHLEVVTRGENVRRGEPGRVWGATQRAKTHCPKGHAYDAENTYIRNSRGYRAYRACDRDKKARRRALELL